MKVGKPKISVISVSYKDPWALSKTIRSVFQQTFDDIEYVVVDGASDDGTSELLDFWKKQGVIDIALIEPDDGVYDAMNKGAHIASGQYIVYMNAGDVFTSSQTLERVAAFLDRNSVAGCLGWGELGDRIWASWHEGTGYRMSSLGFCHQALFLDRQLLLDNPFDTQRGKIDSDRVQLSQCYEQGYEVPVVPEVWAKRGIEAGLSSDLDRSRTSTVQTILHYYPDLSEEEATLIFDFRMLGADPDEVFGLLDRVDGKASRDLSLMVMDCLFQSQTRRFSDARAQTVFADALNRLEDDAERPSAEIGERLLSAQKMRASLMEEKRLAKEASTRANAKFAEEQASYLSQVTATAVKSNEFSVALTSFPDRINTIEHVIRRFFYQSVRPKNVYLTLGRNEIPSKSDLPSGLLELEEEGLCFDFVEKTANQYDKYIHLAKLSDKTSLVIVDDDTLLPENSFETLIEGSRAYPDAVIGNRCHLMAFDLTGRFRPYREWRREQNLPEPAMRLMPTGVGGVLYPVGSLNDGVCADVEQVLRHAPYADDIWLKFCMLSQGRKTFATHLSHRADWYVGYTPSMRAGTLMTTNVEGGLNDLQIQSCAEWLDSKRNGWREDLVAEATRSQRQGVEN